MNKSGLDAVSVIPFVFLLFLVGAGIIIGTSAFYSQSYEFRDVESGVLAENVRNCMKTNDFFAEDFDISKCGLNKNVIEKDHLIYAKRSDGKEFFFGVLDYKTQCALSDKNKEYARCVYFDYAGESGNVNVIVGSNQKLERRVQ